MKTPSSSRIIGAQELTGVRRFKMSDLADGNSPSRPTPTPVPAPDPYAGNPAFAAGREAGMRDGFRMGAQAMRQKIEREQTGQQSVATEAMKAQALQLITAFSEQLTAIEQSVADELVDLAIELARQTVRRTLDVDRDATIGVAQEAIGALLDERGSFSVHVNPADARVVGEALESILSARKSNVVTDPTLAPGGCRVISAGADIDATVETRWRRVLAAIGREAPADDPLCDG